MLHVSPPLQVSPQRAQLLSVPSGTQAFGVVQVFAGQAQAPFWQLCPLPHAFVQEAQWSMVPSPTQAPFAFLHGLSGGQSHAPF